ncbi:hypothetical protein EZS27_017452 [termite gut metagenome]|uniref:Transposase IS116/IS110/IS902 C-terminal domain-containing protein n=1 Tax=termite gut metagenome TaxID=433724 RepID=A0A5J4RM60_9ZZZZ
MRSCFPEIEQEIQEKVSSDAELSRKVTQIQEVKGLGLLTIVTVLCETNGFLLFSNIRQVVSYAGLDVKLSQSGHYQGRIRISKQGNTRIRGCLYMPALSAVRSNEPIRNLHLSHLREKSKYQNERHYCSHAKTVDIDICFMEKRRALRS